jgi:hypothetical protein
MAEVERQLGARVGTRWEEGVPAELRLEQLAADASEQPWLLRAIIAATPRRVVGSVGFHAPPDDHGRVEIGYEIVASERRRVGTSIEDLEHNPLRDHPRALLYFEPPAAFSCRAQIAGRSNQVLRSRRLEHRCP